MPNYHQQLHPWCIVCYLPNAQTLIVARLRRRNDAEAHLRILRQMNPDRSYEIVFDAPYGSDDSDPTGSDSTAAAHLKHFDFSSVLLVARW
jgi:hypothetical protein